MVFTDEQEAIINGAVNHIKANQIDDQLYQFAGKAGTGKTTILLEIIRRIGIPMSRIAIMTYIGQAAIILRTKGIYNARTIHSTLYQAEEENVYQDGKIVKDPVYNKPLKRMVFHLKKSLENIDYMIIDEGYTVPKRMKKDILGFGLKIITSGDTHQLPPVGDEPAFLVEGKVHYLTQAMRQGKGSQILTLADYLSEGYSISPGYYGEAMVIEEDDLTDRMIAASNIVICGTNNTRDTLNSRVRNNILNINQKLPAYGEKIICRKNDWNLEVNGISLANGLIGSVIRDISPLDINTKKKEFIVDFKPDMFNGIFHDLKCDYEYFMANAANRAMLKNNRFNNAAKFEFAYAITTHLSQGAQYPSGIYFKEYFRRDVQSNLDYTGVTRFSDYVIIVLPRQRSRYY
ncbi:MAG: AAA family ATPase [Candidatus Izemoplasmatales bacterium]|nr:AAA family ATPase [Candidatus Izemoplasmatales bacterium]